MIDMLGAVPEQIFQRVLIAPRSSGVCSYPVVLLVRAGPRHVHL